MPAISSAPHLLAPIEVGLGVVESSDLFRLNACTSSLHEFGIILPGMIRDLIELNEPSWPGDDIAVELVAVGCERVTVSAVRDGLRQAIA
jgi:hypothetical protein